MNKGVFENRNPNNKNGNFKNNWRFNYPPIDPLTIKENVAFYCPHLQDVDLSSTTILNLANRTQSGTLESTATLTTDSNGIKEVNFGLTGRVNLSNRYKEARPTVIAIMKNTNNTPAIQIIGSAGTTGTVGYLLFKNGTNQLAWRANIGGATLNQIVYGNRHTFDENTWKMYVGSYDQTTARIYQNNYIATNGGNPLTGAIDYTGITVAYWGMYQGGTGVAARHWQGSGRAYLIFSRALNYDEIIGVYNYFYKLKMVDVIDV